MFEGFVRATANVRSEVQQRPSNSPPRQAAPATCSTFAAMFSPHEARVNERVAASAGAEPITQLRAVSLLKPCRRNLGGFMSMKWLQRPVHTRSFEHEGKTYIVQIYPATDDPTYLKFEVSADGKPVPTPDLADKIMAVLEPNEQQALSQTVERLLQSRTQGSSPEASD